jgi:hypothetical protein
MRRSIGPRFSYLLHDPKCVGISRDVEAQNLAPIVPDDEKAEKTEQAGSVCGAGSGQHGMAAGPLGEL